MSIIAASIFSIQAVTAAGTPNPLQDCNPQYAGLYHVVQYGAASTQITIPTDTANYGMPSGIMIHLTEPTPPIKTTTIKFSVNNINNLSGFYSHNTVAAEKFAPENIAALKPGSHTYTDSYQTNTTVSTHATWTRPAECIYVYNRTTQSSYLTITQHIYKK